MKRFIAALCGCIAVTVVHAADFEIAVHPTDLASFVTLIQSESWQRQLAGRFERVRLRLAAGRYVLPGPLVLNWGAGPTAGVGLDIVGTGNSTVISGAVSMFFTVFRKNRHPVFELPRRMLRLSMSV